MTRLAATLFPISVGIAACHADSPAASVAKSRLEQEYCDDAKPGPRELVWAGEEGLGRIAGQIALMITQEQADEILSCDMGDCRLQESVQRFGDSQGFCPEEENRDFWKAEFGDQRAFDDDMRVCAAVVIGPQELLTISHCVDQANAPNYVAVFDYFLPSDASKFKLVKVDKGWPVGDRHSGPGVPDYKVLDACEACSDLRGPPPTLERLVVLRLERPHGRLPMKWRAAENGELVRAVGFPKGLPMIAAGPGRVTVVDQHYLQAEMRTHEGHSGGPMVAERDHKLVGIHRGKLGGFDFCRPHECVTSVRCTGNPCNLGFAILLKQNPTNYTKVP